MSSNPASPRIALAPGLFAVCLLMGLSACQRPVAYFQRSSHEVFYASTPKPAGPDSPANVPDKADQGNNVPSAPTSVQPVTAYADASQPAQPPGESAGAPARVPYSVAERIRQHQSNARQLLNPAPDSDTPSPISEHQPGPKPKKTLREILGLPPRKKLNWWQRISWQLKASVIVILVAVVFAVLGITVLAIVFGIIGALLLIRGLKKSFKVRRGIFGLGG